MLSAEYHDVPLKVNARDIDDPVESGHSRGFPHRLVLGVTDGLKVP
jgi:hypothetical protein